jgi:hypothetical protein
MIKRVINYASLIGLLFVLMVCICSCSSIPIHKDTLSVSEIKDHVKKLENKTDKSFEDAESIIILKRAEKSLVEKDKQIEQLLKERDSTMFVKQIGKYFLWIVGFVVLGLIVKIIIKKVL